jgi:PEGA domain
MKVRLIAHASNHGGQVAQSVEQRTENPCVECSIHSLPTTKPAVLSSYGTPHLRQHISRSIFSHVLADNCGGIVKKLAVYTLAACSLIGSSCATMLKGTSDEITVVSDPSGAEVSVNDADKGPTPLSFTVPSKQDVNITVAKAGYQPEDLQDPVSFRWGYEAWAFLAYVIPMIVDLSDGAAWGHDHLTMTAHLEPNSQPTSAASVAPPAMSTASEAQASPIAALSPATQIETRATAPLPAPVAAPSASAGTQPAASGAPSLPVASTPE